MPRVESKSVHEIKLNGGDIKRLQNGNSIEVAVEDSIIHLKSTVEDFEEDDTELEDLEEFKEQIDDETSDKGTIVPENMEERDLGGNSRERKMTASGEPKPFTNEEVKIGNDEENLSGMVTKE